MNNLYDKTRDKLDTIENSLDVMDLKKLKNVLSSTKNNLTDVLSQGDTLMVNDEVKANITKIKDRLVTTGGSGGPDTLEKALNDHIDRIRGKGKKKRRQPYRDILADRSMKNRFDEYTALEDLIGNIDLGANITAQTVDIGGTAFGGGAGIDLKDIFTTGGGTNVDSLSIVDDDGNKIKNNGGKYKVKLGGQEVEIKGLTIDSTTGILNITSEFTISPNTVDLSKPLSLNILGQWNSTPGTKSIKAATIKKFELTINDPDKQNLAGRNTTFDDYNTTGGGTKIEDRLLTDYSKEQYKRERDALIRAVKKNDGPKYDKYLDTPEKQEAFYQRIRKKDHPNGGGVFFTKLHTDLAIHTLGIAPDTYGRALNNYDDFKGWFTAKERDWNKDNSPQIKSKSAYMDFIHKELENKVGEYFDSSLDSEMSNNLAINMFLKSEISAFATEIDKTRDENDTHLDVESDLATGERMETLKKDKEYIRFFKGSSWKTEKQEVNLNMNRSPEDVDNPEPLKYYMAIDVKGRNNVQVMINIEGQKPIPFKSGEPHAIIEKILRRRDIPHGSARVHMAYNVMKGFVEMAKEKHIDLSYYDESTTLYHTIDVDEKGNLTKKTIDRNGLSYTQTNETLFDYQNFVNAPSFDSTIHKGALRQGINRTLTHFTLAMNGVHTQYHEANRRRFWFGIKKSKNHFHFPRLKSIGGMNFETTVNTPSGTINISCERNRFTISGGPLEKEKTSKDLGKLLNTKVKGERIFDGAEHEAMESIYSAMLEKLREQKHIKKTNFGVRDHRTGKLYILDKNGDFGIMREDQISVNNPIRKSNNKTKVGQIDDSELAGGMDLVSEEEKHNLLRNPELMYMLLNAMSNRTKFFNLRHLKSGRVAHWWRNLAA